MPLKKLKLRKPKMPIPAMAIKGTLDLALSFASKLMDKLPDYDQKKKEKFLKARNLYNELKQSGGDMDVILYLKEDLESMLQVFEREIEGEVEN